MLSFVRTRRAFTTLAALGAAATLAPAQQSRGSRAKAAAPPAVVAGKIAGPDRKPLMEAEVVLGDSVRTLTDRKGRFAFDPVGAGMHDVVVRKIGFTPVRFRLAVTAGDIWDGTIILERTVQALPEVVVLDSSQALQNFRPQWIEEFMSRRRSGLGTFLDRVDIENSSENSTALLLMRAPGVTARTGISNDVLHVSRCGSMSNASKGFIYLDGALAEVSGNGRFFALRDYPPSTLAAIEVFAGMNAIPEKYYDPTACLVVLLWTRRR